VRIDPQSEFAAAVYRVVGTIPSGRLMSYGDVASQAGFRAYARQVGQLLSRLPTDSQLPWQRVVRADGCLPMAPQQTERLIAEGVVVQQDRVMLKHYRWP